MKKINLIKRLLSDSHEKQKPQRFGRYAAMLLMLLTLGVGQMWADNTRVVGVAATNASNGAVIVKANIGDNNTWWNYTITSNKAGITFEGKKLYIGTMNEKYGGVDALIISVNGTDKQPYSSWTNSSTFQNRIFNYEADGSPKYSDVSMTNGARVYFDATGWSQTAIKLVTGHANHQKYYTLSAITNTKLYYGTNTDTWSDAMGCGIVGGTSRSGANDQWLTDVSANAKEYTGWKNYGLTATSAGNAYLFVNAGKAGEQPTISYHGTHYSTSGGLNYTQTIKYALSTNGGTPVAMSSGTTPGKITMSSYKFVSGTYNAVSSETPTDLSAGGTTYTRSFTAARTATTTLTVSNVVTGYEFVGWYTAANGGTELSTSTTYTYYPTSAKTVYARFREKMFDCRVSSTTSPTTGGTSQSPTSWTSMGQLSGGNISVSANTGYTFKNWTILSGGAGTFGSSTTASTKFYPTKSSELKANFTANTYVITLDKNGGDSDGEALAVYDSTAFRTIAHASRTSYTLNGYYTAESGGTKVISADGSFNNVSSWITGGYWKKASTGTLYAQWTYNPTNYAVTYDVHSSGHGTLSAANTSTSAAISSGDEVASGTGVTFTASPSTGYTVDGWFSNSACTSPIAGAGTGNTYETTISGDLEVYVKFKEQTWSVAFAAGTGGTVTTPNSTPRTVGQLTGISIAATPSSGYTFNTWTITSGSGSFTSAATTNSNTFKPTSASTITASFNETKSTITVTANNTSAGSLKFGETSKAWGQTPSLGVSTSQAITATASDGYVFCNWVLSGAAASASDLTGATITLKANGSGNTGTATAMFYEDYYYRGGKNSWGATKMTPHPCGYYAYYTATTGSHAFKITPNSNNYTGETSTYDNTFGNITLTGGGGADVNCPGDAGDGHYICVLYPSTAINDLTTPIIFAVEGDLPNLAPETTYATTFYAGDHGAINAKGTAIAKNGNASVNIGATARTLTATPESGYSFDKWVTVGSVTVTDPYSASTTVSASAAGGTVTATYLANSGWDVIGDDFGGWGTSSSYDIDRPYRGISGVYYRIENITTTSRYFKFADGTDQYGQETGKDVTIANNTQYSIAAVSGYNTSFITNNNGSVWLVIDGNNKKFWAQTPATYYTVTVSNDGSGSKGTVKLKEKSYGGLETVKFASGETIRVEIDTVAHYSIASVSLGATAVSMSKSGTKYVGDAVMPASDATLTVTYTPWYKVQLAASPAAAADAPTAAKTTGGASVANNSYVLSGTSVTFSKDATPNDGYTFDHWDKNGSNVGSGNTYVATISAATTVTAVYTPNKYTITLDNQCAYSDGTHTGGEATEFEATFGSNYFTYYMNTAPSSYNYTFGGYYSEEGGGGDQIITNLGSLVSGTTVYTTSGNWTYDGEPTLYAKWSKSYTTGLSEGINANGGSGGAITLTYNSSATSGFTPSTRTGYLLAGYYTASDGGSKVINADGSIVSGDVDGYVDDGKWAYCSSTTFKIYAHWTPITYTIAFDKNDDPSFLNSDIGDDPDNIAATYGVLATMPANPYTRMGYTFNGWATEAHKAKGSVPVTDYDYQAGYSYMNLASTQGATVTLYPKWTGNLYTVSLNARGGTCAITSMNVRYGEEYGTGYSGSLPTPLAPYGKTFVGWYTSPTGGTLVTKDTQMSTIGAHTLYARYSDIAMVYFKNTIGWENVFVTYDAYWGDGDGGGTGNYGKIYHKMTQIPGTDIYYDRIPASILASWKGNIAFNSKELLDDDKHAPQESGNWSHYNSGEVVYRMDFDSRATMFVPRDKNTNDEDGNYQKNSAQYISTGYSGESSDPKYTSGYWMKYGDTYSGYLFSYQKNAEGDFSTECGMNTSVAGDTIFVYTVKMEANTRYDLRIRKDCQTTNTKSRQFRYGTEITSAACTDLKLVCDPSNNSWMQTTAAGEYKFILICKKDGHMYLTVKYPLAVNDYQVLYSWNDGSAKNYASEVIKAHPETVDTISVFVHKLESPVISRSMKIQKCTGINGSGVPTWTDVTGGGIDLMDVTASGVYNFEITQPETDDPTGAFAGKYEGNYYIRTACSDGGWDQYKDREENIMTYSAYSMTQTLSTPYSHYYCHYIGSTSTDITFAVATKYSPNISGTMTGDATIGNAATTLPANANVRFSWNEETNAMARAYIKDAQGPSNARFLVMHGANDDMIFNPDGSDIAAAGSLAANELQFDDKGDWVYQVMLQAKPGAQVSIIAKYGSGEGVDRYLVGGPSSFETIMGGSGDNKYTIMAIYDFKTNRLMNAWTPSGDITDALSDVDMLWIRHRQNSAQQITFNGGSLTNVKAVGAIRLDYNDLVGHVASWTYETRPLLRYFIAFPFDVNVSDIFGLHGAELGREFVIRKYDGAERAKNGLFLGDGDTYWIDLTMDSVMHANEGYSLVFDNEYLNGDLGSIWENKTGGSSVYLYFPAAAEIPSISDANKGTILAEHVCEDTRSFDYKGASVSHANSDSHWNLIGSPLFVDSYVYNSWGTNGQAGDKERTTLDSYYAYNVEFNYWEPELYHKGDEYYACKAMHAMLVQFAGSVTWSKNEPNPSLAPSRERKEETVSNLLIMLNLLQNGADGDRTYIKLDEDGNSEFMLCEDLFKIDNKKIPNIFSYASGNAVAYNKVAVESQTINLGVDIRKDGTYTFTMPENVAGQVTLIDTFDATRTNLNIEDYEIYLNKGNYYDRFYLEININKVPTAIDGVTDGSGTLKDGKAHKFIMNDMMYIIRDGVLYDAQGKRVK